jgi:acetate---CoA ligase (ADP-forming)
MPANLSAECIEQELRELRCSVLLEGFRGAPALDVDAITVIMQKIGRLIIAHPNIAEIDVNPVVVYEKGKGVIALDALISVRDSNA